MTIPAFRLDTLSAIVGLAMQFLVYLTVLMVSISTVLLEVHWLTSPAPQPKPAVQAANAPTPRPKVEGPNAELSPVYPKKVETPPPENSAASENTNAAAALLPQATPTQNPAIESANTIEAPQKSPGETTGVATREENARGAAAVSPAPAATGQPQQASFQPQTALPHNRCDVAACASAYKSFRASDCTYQPFDGSRQVCEKPPGGAHNAQIAPVAPITRRADRDDDVRDRGEDRRSRQLMRDDDDDDANFDEPERDAPSLFFFGRRGPRW